VVYRIGPAADCVDVRSVEAIEAHLRSAQPGQYNIDIIAADPLPSGHTSRRWGVGIKFADGSVMLEPDPEPSPTGAISFSRSNVGRV
jgi:hypothetical protein